MKATVILRDMAISNIIGVQSDSITDKILSILKEFVKETTVTFKDIKNKVLDEEATVISRGKIPIILYIKNRYPPFEEQISISNKAIKDNNFLSAIYNNNTFAELNAIVKNIIRMYSETLGLSSLPIDIKIFFTDDYGIKFHINGLLGETHYDLVNYYMQQEPLY